MLLARAGLGLLAYQLIQSDTLELDALGSGLGPQQSYHIPEIIRQPEWHDGRST